MATMTLTSSQQSTARNRAVATAELAYKNAAGLHYSQDMAKRWYGISQHKDASKGQWPSYADCSGLVTWCIWNAVFLPYGMEDIVNGQNWAAGYTGTMLGKGTSVKATEMIAGDAIIYGSGGTGKHTAICVGKSGSTPMVISHGSESGPHYYAYNYRSDIQSCRRYIDGKPHAATNPPNPPPPPEDAVALTAILKQDGRIELFVQKDNGSVMHTWQKEKNGSWAGSGEGKNASWYGLGNPGK